MRIRDFTIERFGCFEQHSLDFATGPSDFHIIYGPNEAGKSTALRAIVNFLYGIPGQTDDNFLYSYEQMRLTATLEKPDGTVATFIRRKANKASLLDEHLQPIDESVLASFLCGIPQASFTTMFGFDYQTLLGGRRDLMAGKGDLAESLFQAGLGITGLREVLGALEREKDGLFSSRGNASTPAINSALRQYKDAMKAVVDLSVKPREWLRLQEEIRQCEAGSEEVRKAYTERSADRARQERFQKAFPLVSQRNQVVETLASFDQSQILTPSQIERYESARTRLGSALAEGGRIAERRQEIVQRWSDPGLIKRLLDSGENIARLQTRLEQFESAQKDLRKVSDEQGQYQSEAVAIFESMGAEHALDDPSFFCITSGQRIAIAEFAHARLAVPVPKPEVLTANTEDSAALKRSIEAASEEGKVERSAAQAKTTIRELRGNAEKALLSLALWQGALEEAERLPLPLSETVNRFEREITDTEAGIRETDRDLSLLREERVGLVEQIGALQRERPVPKAEQLTNDRARRQQGWSLVRRAWLNADDVAEESEEFDSGRSLDRAYEVAVDKADDTADLLRSEADRVASLQQKSEAVSRIDEKLDGLEARLQGLQDRKQDQTAEWAELWKGSGMAEPLSPAEMREWLRRHEKILELCKTIRDEETRLGELEATIAHHREQILRDLAALGLSAVADEVSLEDIILIGREAVEKVGRLRELAAKVEQSNSAASRVQQMSQSIDESRKLVSEAIAQTGMAELAAMDVGPAARALQKMYGEAVRDQTALDLLEKQHKETKDTECAASSQMAALAAEASFEDVGNLGEAVESSRKHSQLAERLAELDELIAAFAAGGSVPELVKEMSEVEADSLEATIAEFSIELDELDMKRDELSKLQGQKQSDLAALDHSEDLAEEVQNAQSALAKTRSAVEQYVSFHVASEMLSMEIERYQRENQDPVLARATETFPALTLGSFKQVATQYNTRGTQVIVGVRPTGAQVEVAGMSDGTRDQLYLALRTASLEQHLKNGIVLPFIVDDILIEFDDERAAAALELLAELSHKTQVLYFTHHKHVAELGMSLLGGERITTCQLG